MNYTSSVTYDGSGRPETLTYPSGFAVRNGYNARGYLASVAEEGGATVFWRADAVNAEGQVTRETFGNGVVTTKAYDPRTGLIDTISTDLAGTVIQDLAYDFDAIGNLEKRSDRHQDREESFLYDGLNRLTTTTLVDTAPGGGTLATTAYTYDALGNLKTKSDVGTYSYGGAGAGPHAVTAAGGETYAYDFNGNMTAGAGRSLAYASFNKPTLIEETATGNEAGFVYGPDRARIKQQVVDGGLARSVVYVGGLYERRSQFGSPDELVHYVTAGATVAIHTIYDDGLPATNKARYLHRDHLGSIESITGETGAVVQRLSFDAHGKRRLADWTAGDPVAPGAETPRGFTGHEHLDSVGLIHMNGRVYDPTLGRFLSADPIVPNPTATQSFNRYSYVGNNPLSYTDPTGLVPDAGEMGPHGQSDNDGRASTGSAFGQNPDNRFESSDSFGQQTTVPGGDIPGNPDAGGQILGAVGIGALTGGPVGAAVNGLGAIAEHMANAEIDALNQGKRNDKSIEADVVASQEAASDSGRNGRDYAHGVLLVSGDRFSTVGFDGPVWGSSPSVEISLGYTKVPGFAIHGEHHTFVIATNPATGEQYITRAGPSPDGVLGSSGASSSSASGGSFSASGGDGGSGGFGFGYIQATPAEKWNEAIPFDKPSNTVLVQRVGTVDLAYSEVVRRMNVFAKTTNEQQMPYFPAGPNSNSYSFTFLNSLGFRRPKPALNAIGWVNPLPIKKLSYSPR